MKYVFLLWMAGISFAHATSYPVTLGNTKVVIQHYIYGKGKTFVHVHHNETTALRAALQIARKEGGQVFTLVHAGQRNIIFYGQHQRYEFDPNRIFSDNGIKKTLMQYGSYTPWAHAEVRKLANVIKKQLPQGKIIAVHNNRSYSLKNYTAGQPLAAEARAVSIRHGNYYRNFCLVTQRKDYVHLKKMRINSIWQAAHATDDGSLSVYLAHRDYVNVEAGYDQLAAQIRMLKYA